MGKGPQVKESGDLRKLHFWLQVLGRERDAKNGVEPASGLGHRKARVSAWGVLHYRRMTQGGFDNGGKYSGCV